MPKTIEEMTIGELEAAIKEKRRLAKKAPKLRKERAAIIDRLNKIDAQLALIGGRKVANGPAADKPAAKVVKKTVSKKAAKKPVKKAAAKPAKKKSAKKPAKEAAPKPKATNKGKSVKQLILDFLGESKDLRKTAEIRKALPADAKSKTVYNTLGKLKKSGAVVHENGMYGVKLPE